MVPGNNLVLKVWFGYRLIYSICNCSKKETKTGKMIKLYVYKKKPSNLGWMNNIIS